MKENIMLFALASVLLFASRLLSQVSEKHPCWPETTNKVAQPETLTNNFDSQEISLTVTKQNSNSNVKANFFSGPEVKTITASSLTLQWTNNLSATFCLMYGETPALELDTVKISGEAGANEHKLTGLKPATLYYVRLSAVEQGEEKAAADRILMTASAPEATGEIKVYFTQSVNHDYATAELAAGNTNLLTKFKERVSAAKYSIDVCFYIFYLPDAAGSLVRAKLRGCKIRVIVDNQYENNDAVLMLKNAGIPVITDAFGYNSGSPAMHNKFMIVDYRDTTSAADDWVWLGSANLAESSVTLNAENVVEIQDQALAACYTLEFNEMWGSDSDVPNETTSRFGNRKTDNTPHEFNVNGIEILQYFSASDGGRDFLIEQILKAERSLYFCMLIFKQTEIANAMYSRWNSQDRVQVKGVFDHDANYNDYTSLYYSLAGQGSNPWNPPADVFIDPDSRTLHHKYLIIDSEGSGAAPMVATGSYNWSYAAEFSNDENFVIIKDAAIANLYLQEFAARYSAAGGSEPLTAVHFEEETNPPSTFFVAQNYPNPFNKITRIDYSLTSDSELKLVIVNLLGQEVKILKPGWQVAGNHSLNWDGTDNRGASVAAGVYGYYFRLASGQKSNSRKMIYLP